LKRAICFSSPKDWRNIPDSPPLWLSSGNWQTSSSNIYAFNHTLDEHTNHQLEIWDSLGLNNYGSPVNVDNSSTPYNNTRQLTTSYNVPNGDDHACTVQDNKTPKVSGTPVFLPVWTYMLTDNLTTGLPNASFDNNFKLQLTPNPTSDIVSINVIEDEYTIKVYDQIGKCVIENNFKSGKTEIDLSILREGLYFVRVSNNKKVYSGKIIKQ